MAASTWVAVHLRADAALHTAALFVHLASLVLGFGAVLAVDYYGALWLGGRKTLRQVLDFTASLHTLVWAGLIGLIGSGALLHPDLGSPLTASNSALSWSSPSTESRPAPCTGDWPPSTAGPSAARCCSAVRPPRPSRRSPGGVRSPSASSTAGSDRRGPVRHRSPMRRGDHLEQSAGDPGGLVGQHHVGGVGDGDHRGVRAGLEAPPFGRTSVARPRHPDPPHPEPGRVASTRTIPTDEDRPCP